MLRQRQATWLARAAGAILVLCGCFVSLAPAEIIRREQTIVHNGKSLNMWFVHVGNKGNDPHSSTQYGAVDYNYWIGEFEVSIAQWAAFYTDTNSNKVGGSGGYGFSSSYNHWQGSSGTAAPASHVSWHNVAQFCNWLTTGNATTGVYAIDTDVQSGTYGGVIGIDRGFRNDDGIAYVIPSEDEWYKAAYYDPHKEGGPGYWFYPTQQASGDLPLVLGSDGTGGTMDPNEGAVYSRRGWELRFSGGHSPPCAAWATANW